MATMWYFNRVKIISLIETDVSEAPVGTSKKLNRTEFVRVRGYARFTLEHIPLHQRMTLAMFLLRLGNFFNLNSFKQILFFLLHFSTFNLKILFE
jgi:hypothetical protein